MPITLAAPPESFKDRVDRFGIELELLDPYYEDDDDYCNCEDCVAERGYRESPSGDERCVDIAVDEFRRRRLTNFSYLHEYHCHCNECDPFRTGGALFAAQEDCTVGVEFVSRIIALDSEDLTTVATALPPALSDVYRLTGQEPDGYKSWGNHIHVGLDGGSSGRGFRRQTVSRAMSWIEGFLAEFRPEVQNRLATGGCAEMRGYNGSGPSKALTEPVGPYGRGRGYSSWLGSNPGTVEFRIWNTPVETDLVEFHAASSVAMARTGLWLALAAETFTLEREYDQDKWLSDHRNQVVDMAVSSFDDRFPHAYEHRERFADSLINV